MARLWEMADFSTFNEEKVRRSLKPYTKPPTYHYDKDPGNYGTSMLPPGHPSYFVWKIWTQHGNSPTKGTESILRLSDGSEFALPKNTTGSEESHQWLSRFWNPLPQDDERVIKWVQHCCAFWKNWRGDKGQYSELYAQIHVRKYYPDLVIPREWLENPDSKAWYGCGSGHGSWWEMLAEKPSPENCPGDSLGKHPNINPTCCQFCGWQGK